MKHIGIIGCGNMGGAIAEALQDSGLWSVSVYDNDRDRLASFCEEHGCSAKATLAELISNSPLTLIAVKPQILPSLYPELKKNSSKETGWISIAAGVSLEVLSSELGSTHVVRFMPNIAAQQKKAVTAVASHKECPPDLAAEALGIAQTFGSAFSLPESQFAAFIGISGSAIAFVFQFLHALAMGGVQEGIPYPMALAIANDTAISATTLLEASGKNPVELATMVCSAGGTTIEGMKALAEGKLDATIMQAVSAAAGKSRTLEAAANKRH